MNRFLVMSYSLDDILNLFHDTASGMKNYQQGLFPVLNQFLNSHSYPDVNTGEISP